MREKTMKRTQKILTALLLSTLLLLSASGLTACGGTGGISNIGGIGSNDEKNGGSNENVTLGQTFEVDGLELTLSNNIGYSRVRERYADYNNELVFSIPTTVKNVGTGSNTFDGWLLTVFTPDGTSGNYLGGWVYQDTNILSKGAIQPGTTIEGSLYILYDEDGEYILEFDDFDNKVIVKIAITFDHEAVPELKTEFALGETLVIDGMEITIMDSIAWGTVRNNWSDYAGEPYFYFPVALHNASDKANRFPYDFEVFGPDGKTIKSITWDLDEDDITRMDDILPGADTTGDLHIMYTGDGEYTLLFRDWSSDDELRVIVPIKLDPEALPVIQTEFALNETLVFDDLEITIHKDFEWAKVVASWHDLNGESVFALPVTVKNIGEETKKFPWNVKLFGSNGLELENVSFMADEDITRSGDIRPGATLSGKMHILYDGDGEYIIVLSNYNDTVQVIFDVIQ